MAQETERPGADGDGQVAIQTTRAPVRFDGRVLKNGRGAPHLGAHTEALRLEFSEKA
jgi:crotonobetainyl-CoA:carnitine CoA-transferase CaiB-like acyl-CoA transferase